MSSPAAVCLEDAVSVGLCVSGQDDLVLMWSGMRPHIASSRGPESQTMSQPFQMAKH